MSDYSMDRRTFLTAAAGTGAAAVLGSQPVSGDHDKDVLKEFKNTLDGNYRVTIAEKGDKHRKTVCFLGVEDTHRDLYGVSFGDDDNAFVYQKDGVYKDIANRVSQKGRELVKHHNLPDDEPVDVYLGITGRNNSFLPGKLTFRPDENVNPRQKAHNYLEDLQDQTGEAMNFFTPHQMVALHHLGTEEYEDRELMGITRDVDGMRDGRYDNGQFTLNGEEAELLNVEDNTLDQQQAHFRYEYKGDWIYPMKELGKHMEVGGVILKITHMDPDSGYAELQRTDGDSYDHLKNMPFPQVKMDEI